MKKDKGEFFPGQMVEIWDLNSRAHTNGIVIIKNVKEDNEITVRANSINISFSKETLEGKTIFGACILRHARVKNPF